jgi:hypothetical protein
MHLTSQLPSGETAFGRLNVSATETKGTALSGRGEAQPVNAVPREQNRIHLDFSISATPDADAVVIGA